MAHFVTADKCGWTVTKLNVSEHGSKIQVIWCLYFVQSYMLSFHLKKVLSSWYPKIGVKFDLLKLKFSLFSPYLRAEVKFVAQIIFGRIFHAPPIQFLSIFRTTTSSINSLFYLLAGVDLGKRPWQIRMNFQKSVKNRSTALLHCAFVLMLLVVL